MSVRSFTQLCPDAPPAHPKLSVILRRVQDDMRRNRSRVYICLNARYVAMAMGLDSFAAEDIKDRVSRLLEENGIGIGGDWFSEHYSACRSLWDGGVGIHPNAFALAQRTARLAVLSVLIHQLEARGE